MGSIKDKLKTKITVAISGIAVALGIGVERSAIRFVPEFFNPKPPKIEFRSPKTEPWEGYGKGGTKKGGGRVFYNEPTTPFKRPLTVEEMNLKVKKFEEFGASNRKIEELEIRIRNESKQNNESELLTKYKEELNLEVRNNTRLKREALEDFDIKKAQENSLKLLESISPKRPSTELEITSEGFCVNGKPVSEAQIKDLIKANPKVIIKGNLSEQHALQLRNLGIDIVFDKTVCLFPQTNYQFIYVAPKGDVQLNRIFSKAKNNTRSSFVQNKEELIKSIENAKQNNKEPILIFDNKNDLLFDEPISKYGVRDVITCNSYAIENGKFSMMTTNKVNASNVVKALNKIPDEAMYKDDLYMQFSKNYYGLQNITKYEQGLMYAGFGTGLGGGIITIVFINK